MKNNKILVEALEKIKGHQEHCGTTNSFVCRTATQALASYEEQKEGKTDKGWIALFNDEKEWCEYLKWRKKERVYSEEEVGVLKLALQKVYEYANSTIEGIDTDVYCAVKDAIQSLHFTTDSEVSVPSKWDKLNKEFDAALENSVEWFEKKKQEQPPKESDTRPNLIKQAGIIGAANLMFNPPKESELSEEEQKDVMFKMQLDILASQEQPQQESIEKMENYRGICNEHDWQTIDGKVQCVECGGISTKEQLKKKKQ